MGSNPKVFHYIIYRIACNFVPYHSRSRFEQELGILVLNRQFELYLSDLLRFRASIFFTDVSDEQIVQMMEIYESWSLTILYYMITQHTVIQDRNLKKSSCIQCIDQMQGMVVVVYAVCVCCKPLFRAQTIVNGLLSTSEPWH